MNSALLDSVLSRCDALRRGNRRLRDAELRRLGALQRDIYRDSIELARLREGLRETIASDARTRDWARLERIIATTSSVAMLAGAGTALMLAIDWTRLERFIPTASSVAIGAAAATVLSLANKLVAVGSRS